MNPLHVMIDIETLGVGNDAAILSIGAVRFDPTTGQSDLSPFHVKVQFDCADQGRIDGSTVEWWLKQSDEARKALLDGVRLPLADALEQLSGWLKSEPVEAIWANDPDFDLTILRSAYARCMLAPMPISFRAHRSVRTMNWLAQQMKMQVVVTGSRTAHDALSDAIVQAQVVSRIFQLLSGDYVRPTAA